MPALLGGLQFQQQRRSHVIFPRTNAHFLRSLCRVRRALAQNVALEIQRRDQVESYTYAELRHMAESVGAWLGSKRIAVRRAGRHSGRQPSPLGGRVPGRGRRRDAPPCRSTPPCTPTRSPTLLKDSGSSLLFCDVKHLATARGGDRRSLPIKIALINPAEQNRRQVRYGQALTGRQISTASLRSGPGQLHARRRRSGCRRLPALHLRHDRPIPRA